MGNFFGLRSLLVCVLLLSATFYPAYAAPASQAGSVPSTCSTLKFQPGATSATVQATNLAYQTRCWTAKAAAGQIMNVDVTAADGPAILTIRAPSGALMLGAQANSAHFSGTLPQTGDYVIGVQASSVPQCGGYPCPVNYATVRVEILPLGQGGGGCYNGYPTRLAVGQTATVVDTTPHNVRTGPSTSAPKVGTMQYGETAQILSGPQCSGGMYWWYVRSNKTGLTGWTAEGTSTTTWLVPSY